MECERCRYGKVTSYGEIATCCGYPKHSRLVGTVLKTLTPAEHGDDTAGAGEVVVIVPWWRVVNGKGIISPREAGLVSVTRQADRLRAEGVNVDDATDGDLGNGGQVNLFLYSWDYAGVTVPEVIE